jgi:hypothetical protein
MKKMKIAIDVIRDVLRMNELLRKFQTLHGLGTGVSTEET